MHIGKKIEFLRKKQGLSQYKLAKISKVSQAYISDIEAGKKNPTIDKLEQICTGLRVTVTQLLSDNTENLSFEIKRLVESAKRLTPEQLQLLSKFIESLELKEDDPSE